MYIFILVSFYLLDISDEYVRGHIWKYISGQMMSNASDVTRPGPPKGNVWEGKSLYLMEI